MVLYLGRIASAVFTRCSCHTSVFVFDSLLQNLACTAGLLFPYQCPSGTILLNLHSMVFDWRVSRAGPMHFYWHKLLYPYLSSTIFPFIFFLSTGWYCGASLDCWGVDHALSALHCRPLSRITIMIIAHGLTTKRTANNE